MRNYRVDAPEILPIPDDIIGAARVKDWIVQNSDNADVVVLYDDDVTACKALCNLRCRALTPAETVAMVENTAYCAAGAGALVFGWNVSGDPRNAIRNDPFRQNQWCSGVIGVIGKKPRWDQMMTFKGDIDFNLRELLERRIVWQDSRFAFKCGCDKNIGGNSLFRSPAKIDAEKRYLSSRWKAHISFSECKSQDIVKIHVERRQKVDL